MALSTFKVSFADDLGVEVVDVYVGPERKRYVVHKNLLTKKSEYFLKALTGSFMEAEENSIYLKEEDPEAVALLIGWLYRGVIPGTDTLTSPFIKSIFSFSETIQVPISEQGTLYPFAPTQVPVPTSLFGGFGSNTGSGSDYFHHICSQTQYAIFSPEELRLADYRLDRKYQGDLTMPAAPVAGAALNLPPAQPFNPFTAAPFSQPASQPTPTQAPSLFTGLATASNSQNAGPFSQPNPTQRQSIFAPLYSSNPFGVNNSASGPPISNIFGGPAPPTQTSNPSAGLNNSTTRGPNSNIFGGQAPPANQTSNIFAHLSAPPSNTLGFAASQAPVAQSASTSLFNRFSGPTGPNLFGGAAHAARQNSNPPTGVNNSNGQASSPQGLFSGLSSSSTAQPTGGLFGTAQPTAAAQGTNVIQHTGGLFGTAQATGGLFGTAQPTAIGQTTITSQHTSGLFGTAQATGGLFGTAQPTAIGQPISATQHTGGLFGNLFPPAQPVQNNPPSYLPGFHYSVYGSETVLPPGASMITIRPQKPVNPSDFGYYSFIKHSKSPRVFVNGIPEGDPMDEQFIDLEKLQTALLNLCIMAETQCWPTLFNDAINAYIRGEHKLQRSISLDFIDRIYTRTHPDSTLRAYVLDSISRIKTEGMEDISPYIKMANKHEDFLADLLSEVMGSSAPLKDINNKTVENYHMYGMDNEDPNYYDDGQGDQSSDHAEGHIQ